jgi:hypothetical protein
VPTALESREEKKKETRFGLDKEKKTLPQGVTNQQAHTSHDGPQKPVSEFKFAKPDSRTVEEKQPKTPAFPSLSATQLETHVWRRWRTKQIAQRTPFMQR